MYSLSISTSGKYISVALFSDKLISSSSVLAENGNTNLLMNSIDELTLKSNIKKSDINVIYLDTGPGFYTSLRIGLAVSQGICATLGIPLISVNGLDALAFAAHTGHRKICSIIDIKRDEFAFCTYKPVPGGVVRESEPEVLNENTLKQKLNEDNEKKLIVGDWNELNEKIIGDSSYLKFGSPEYVSAEHIYNVGKEIYKNSDFPNFNEVRISYMREPDISFSNKSLESQINFHD